MRLINADALIDTLYDHEFASYIDKGEVSTVINDEPTVDAQPVRHGKWIYLDKDNKFFKKHIVECSLCNNSLDLYAVNGGRGDANYCPNCGAKMEKTE